MTDPAQLQAALDEMKADLDSQRALNDRLTAKALNLEEMIEATLTEPEDGGPTPPGKVFIDPLCGLTWRSGFGQAAAAHERLEKMRGRKAGAVAGWTLYSKFAQDWNGLRGGPLGKPEARQGIFSREGAFNFHDYVRTFTRKGLLIWIVPVLPGALNNEYLTDAKAARYKKSKGWQNPGVYKKLIDPKQDRGVTIVNFTDQGERLGNFLGQNGINPALFILVVGWEDTGHWYPWSIGPDMASNIIYKRLVVDSLRAGLRKSGLSGWEKVRFEHRLAGATAKETATWDPLDSFPGNSHFSVLGCSIHGGRDSLGSDEGWRQELMGHGPSGKVGLQPMLQLARKHDVPFGMDEWMVISRTEAGDQHHPVDPYPRKAMTNVLGWCMENAEDISHECVLYSSKGDLLKADWPGQVGYVEALNQAAARVKRLS